MASVTQASALRPSLLAIAGPSTGSARSPSFHGCSVASVPQNGPAGKFAGRRQLAISAVAAPPRQPEQRALRSTGQANPDYKGVCHVALAQEGHCRPGEAARAGAGAEERGLEAGALLEGPPTAALGLGLGLGLGLFLPLAASAATIASLDSSANPVLLLADLDPSTAKTISLFLGPFISLLNFLFILRIVMSWYPQLPVNKLPFSAVYAPTEPVLGPTRRLIPPIGGVDVSPVIWVALMSFINEILLGSQGLLVLLSQKQP